MEETGTKITRCVDHSLNIHSLIIVLQIPRHLLQHIPRPREVVFRLTRDQLVSNAISFVSYNTEIVEGTDVQYLGCRATPRASTSLSARVTIPSLPAASGLARRPARDDGAVGCEGAEDVRNGDGRVRANTGTQRCRVLVLIGESFQN